MAAIPVQSSNCRYDDCTCPKYSVHRFKFTLSCIDCGHLADFHDANAEEVEANFSLAHTLIIQPLESPLDFEKRRGKLERKPSGSNEWEGNEREDDDDDDGVRSQVGSSDFIRPMITEAVVEHQPFLQAPKDFSQFASMTMIQQVEDIYSDVADPSLFVTKRDHIIRELFTTEQTYVTSLTFLINEYKVVMQEDAVLEKECPRIFLSLPEILFTNKTLLHKLHSKVMHWSSDLTIGDDLVCLFPYMRMYKMYCSAYESAAKRVQDLLQSNAAFAQLNEQNRRKPEARGLDILSFLIMPVQRIPRYTLLLQDLVKHTPIEHPDYIGVCEAMNKFRQLAVEVNEGIRDSENRAITIEIQNQFSPPIQIVASHRSLILKGSVTKVGRSVKLRRHLFLFSDLFLNAKGSQEKGYQMNHMASIDNLLFVPSLRYQERSFGIRTETRSYTLICDTEVDYKAWIEAFRRALQIARSRSTIMRPTSTQLKEVYFAPLWQPDDTTDVCMSCSGKFTFMTRKHHCRVCGLVVCNSCSPNRVHIQGSSERVCSKCKESHLPK